MSGHLVDSEGFTLDKDRSVHSPLLFLLANTLPNNLLDFRILDLVVASWLHSLEKVKKNQDKSIQVSSHVTILLLFDKGKGSKLEFSLNIGLFQPRVERVINLSFEELALEK